MRSALTLVFALLTAALAACSGSNPATSDATHDGVPAGCGDGVKAGTEACDGTDLGGGTCASATAPGWVGVVSCTASCSLNIAGCNPPPTTWNSITDAANWSAFDLTTLFPGAKGFTSSVFDGRYLYLIPNSNGAADGIVARFDTQGGFGSSSSWQTFDVSTVSAAAKGFQGGAFDGRYLYLIPYNNGVYDGVIARYDTKIADNFGNSSAWSTFDIATVDPNARGYVRATFDGRYLYLVPHYNAVVVGSNPGYHGIIARYDTQATFAESASWLTFDIGSVNPNAKGFLGATFDGRYVYLSPYYSGTAYNGLVTRYDTQSTAGFTDASSWSFFDASTVNSHDVGFYSITFDGRFLYLGQYYDGTATVPAYGGNMVRYDTQATFSTASSWSSFDVSTVNAAAKGFVGATYDGRYVYFSPHYNGAYHGNVARFDTTAGGFASAASWSTFNMATINPGATGMNGLGFDGQYIYVVPAGNPSAHGIITRFATKSPSWMPRGWSNTFD